MSSRRGAGRSASSPRGTAGCRAPSSAGRERSRGNSRRSRGSDARARAARARARTDAARPPCARCVEAAEVEHIERRRGDDAVQPRAAIAASSRSRLQKRSGSAFRSSITQRPLQAGNAVRQLLLRRGEAPAHEALAFRAERRSRCEPEADVAHQLLAEKRGCPHAFYLKNAYIVPGGWLPLPSGFPSARKPGNLALS